MSIPHISRRFLSTAKSHSASEACAEIFHRFMNAPISKRMQLLDANQIQLLSLALGRENVHRNVPVLDQIPREGTPIPPGYHLVYFTPAQLETQLGLDGTDRTASPLAPFSRRMWAGGDLEWNQDPVQFLRVGQTVTEVTKLLSAEPKKLKSGDEMLVVGVEKTFETEKGIALTDRRNWVFQKEILPGSGKTLPSKPEEKPLAESKSGYARDFRQSRVSLFRFSALTFNGHKIHYSKEWCKEVEGHRDCVVHGPLNLINMLDLWRDSSNGASEGIVPKSITYRAMSPLYVGEQYRIILDKNSGRKWKIEVHDSFGRIGMEGSIIE